MSDSESTQAGQRRRPIGTVLIVGLAIVVVVSTVVVGVRFLRGAADGEKQVIYADGAGGLSATLPGYDYRVAAPPDTFPAGERLEVKPAEKTPDIGSGKFLGTPIEITSRVQPAHPVSLEISYPKVNLELSVGSLWDKDATHIETAPLERTEDGDLRVYLQHFSGGGIVAFPSLDALTQWHAGPLADGVIHYLKDFIDAPYDCPPLTLQSSMVISQGYPSRSVNIQLDVNDSKNLKSTVTITICNRLRFAMAYKATGAGEATGFSLPRSTLPLDVHLQGVAGDPFTLDAKFTPDAVTATLALFAIDMLPSGSAITSELIKEGLSNSATIKLIANSTRSCSSSINAALSTPGPGAFDGAVSCLKNLSSFNQAVIDTWTRTAAQIGLTEAAKSAGLGTNFGLIMRGQALNRIGAELHHFGLPRDVSFPYRLVCAKGSDIACRNHAAESQAPVRRPGPSPTHTPAAPTSLTLQDGIATVDEKGYDASAYAKSNISGEDEWDATTLKILLGVKRPGDSYNQRAFFFLKDRYLGTDARLPSARITFVSQTDTTTTIRYTLYRPADPLAAPTGGSATVRYYWNGRTLVPLDPIPSADWSAPLSRRGGRPASAWPSQSSERPTQSSKTPSEPGGSTAQNGSTTATGTEVQFKRLFTRDSHGVESATLRCGGSQVQLAAEFLNNSSSTVDATAQLGVFDPGLSLYQYLETFNVKLNPGLTTITEPWIPQHWVAGSMRYDLKVQWADGAVSERYSFNLAFDPSCAQPPSESGGVSATGEATAAASEASTIEPSETQTSAPTETTTAPTAEATPAPETSSSANR